jgi:gamma-glutamyltranspeptidase / glutathione hydrolase
MKTTRRALAPIAAPVAALLAATAPQAMAEAPDQPEATQEIAERQSVTAESYMVAAAHPLATEAGRAVLAAGGTAADAAVTVQLVLNLVEPQSSGLGGGGFVLHWSAEDARLTSYDGRERAPLDADETYWLGEDGQPVDFWDAVVGGRSVGVPGTPMLLETLHARHGRLDWAELVKPAIDLSEEGFEVSPRLAGAIADANELDRFEETRAYFFDADGAPLEAGTVLQNPAFAETLRLYAAEGARPFYAGEIAEAIVEAVRTEENTGILTMEDMTAYEVVEREPVCIDYRGREVCGMGPPSSGALTVGQILGKLEGFDLPGMGPGTEAHHLFLEASRLAFADRALYMADGEFVDMPEGLLDREYLADRADLIDPERSLGEAEAGEPPWEAAQLRGPDAPRPREGTTHFVIVDADGNMISATTTIEAGFGSRVMTNGFLLNNELTDFSRTPEDDEGRPIANRVEGGKRPRSSMAPTVVLEDGRPVLLAGSPGGIAIIPYTAWSVIGILDWEMDPQEAIDRPHLVNFNGPTGIEAGAEAEALAEALEALGHETDIRDLNSGLHVIRVADDHLVGAADKRREGVAAGE